MTRTPWRASPRRAAADVHGRDQRPARLDLSPDRPGRRLRRAQAGADRGVRRDRPVRGAHGCRRQPLLDAATGLNTVRWGGGRGYGASPSSSGATTHPPSPELQVRERASANRPACGTGSPNAVRVEAKRHFRRGRCTGWSLREHTARPASAPGGLLVARGAPLSCSWCSVHSRSMSSCRASSRSSGSGDLSSISSGPSPSSRWRPRLRATSVSGNSSGSRCGPARGSRSWHRNPAGRRARPHRAERGSRRCPPGVDAHPDRPRPWRDGAALGATAALQWAATSVLPVLALPAISSGALPVNHRLDVAAYLGAGVLVLLIAVGVAALATDVPLLGGPCPSDTPQRHRAAPRIRSRTSPAGCSRTATSSAPHSAHGGRPPCWQQPGTRASTTFRCWPRSSRWEPSRDPRSSSSPSSPAKLPDAVVDHARRTRVRRGRPRRDTHRRRRRPCGRVGGDLAVPDRLLLAPATGRGNRLPPVPPSLRAAAEQTSVTATCGAGCRARSGRPRVLRRRHKAPIRVPPRAGRFTDRRGALQPDAQATGPARVGRAVVTRVVTRTGVQR